MTIAYLDPDDEITNAVARLRASKDVRVALVLPTGSRIATSRINFRLLAHEALAHTRRLAIVASEPGVRAVAISAGLPAYATVVEYEAALQEASAGRAAAVGEAATTIMPKAAGPAPKSARSRAERARLLPRRTWRSRRTAAGVAAGVAAPSVSTGYLPPVGPASGSSATTGAVHRGGVPDLPVVTARDRSDGGGRRWAWIGISGLLVVALVVAAGWIAFNVLPTADDHGRAAHAGRAAGRPHGHRRPDRDGRRYDPRRGPSPGRDDPPDRHRHVQRHGHQAGRHGRDGHGDVRQPRHRPGSHDPARARRYRPQSGVVFATTKAVTVPRAIFSPPTSWARPM